MVSWRLTWAWPAPSRPAYRLRAPRRHRLARPALRRHTTGPVCCPKRHAPPPNHAPLPGPVLRPDARARERVTPSVFFSTNDEENEEIRGNLVFCLCF